MYRSKVTLARFTFCVFLIFVFPAVWREHELDYRGGGVLMVCATSTGGGEEDF